MAVRKTFSISEDNYEMLKNIKEANDFSSESQVINYLLNKEKVNTVEQIAVAVREELEKNYIQKERIRWATQTAEQNSIVILDVLNTLCYKEQLEGCVSVEFRAHPVVAQARDILKEKIAYFKQKSDERKAKHSQEV